MRSGDMYFMMGHLNHHVQHAVLAGANVGTARYSSTPRVAVGAVLGPLLAENNDD